MQKPFDLQKALAGAPVVTRDGRRVIGLVLLPAKGEFPLAGMVEGDENIYTWKKTGGFLRSSTCSSDLFLDVPVVQKTVLGRLNFPTLKEMKEADLHI